MKGKCRTYGKWRSAVVRDLIKKGYSKKAAESIADAEFPRTLTKPKRRRF